MVLLRFENRFQSSKKKVSDKLYANASLLKFYRCDQITIYYVKGYHYI